MVDHPYQFTMKPTGEVSDVAFADELTAAINNLPGGLASGGTAAYAAKYVAARFPKTAPAAGEGWTVPTDFTSVSTGPLRLSTDFTPAGSKEEAGRKLEAFTLSTRFAPEVEGNRPEVTVEMKESSGEVLFDREKGRLHRSTVNQTMEIRSPTVAKVVTNEVAQTIEWRALDSDEEAATAE
jgi:hypothetical protein